MKKIRLTEEQLRNVVKKVIEEQMGRSYPTIPKDTWSKIGKGALDAGKSTLAMGNIPYAAYQSGKRVWDALKKRWVKMAAPSNQNQTAVPPTQQTAQKPKYRFKENFPFPVYSQNKLISQLQQAIGLPPNQQKGFFGPITNQKLQSMGHDMSNGLTQEIFNDVITKYKQSVNQNTTDTSAQVSGPTSTDNQMGSTTGQLEENKKTKDIGFKEKEMLERINKVKF